MHGGSELEPLRLDRLARPFASGLLEELDDDHGGEEEGERRPTRVERLPRADGNRGDAEEDRAEDRARRPHGVSIGEAHRSD